MKNEHAPDGIAEDLIRSFIQIACAEMHTKTLLEKRMSELENGFVELDHDLMVHLNNIEELKHDLTQLATIRREDMLYLFNLYGAKGDKEQWCHVKHLAVGMMTAFEAWQACHEDEELLNLYLKKNKLFLKATSQFLGVEITQCASCFSDLLKSGN